MPRSSFFECWVLSQLFCSFTFIKRLFNFSSLSAIQVVLSAYLRLLFLPAILIPACESSSPAFCMMYSAYKLNKQSDNTQPRIFLVYSFPNFEPVRYCVSSSNCCFTLSFWLFISSLSLEKGMATHSSTLAWRIPRTEEPGRLQSMGLQRVGRDERSTHAAQFASLSFCF